MPIAALSGYMPVAKAFMALLSMIATLGMGRPAAIAISSTTLCSSGSCRALTSRALFSFSITLSPAAKVTAVAPTPMLSRIRACQSYRACWGATDWRSLARLVAAGLEILPGPAQHIAGAAAHQQQDQDQQDGVAPVGPLRGRKVGGLDADRAASLRRSSSTPNKSAAPSAGPPSPAAGPPRVRPREFLEIVGLLESELARDQVGGEALDRVVHAHGAVVVELAGERDLVLRPGSAPPSASGRCRPP